MLKIDVISGFLGAGKTTFIKRLLETKLKDEKVVLIENEYGAVSIDTDLLSDEQIRVKELSQGCICCSLVGDFSKSLNEVINKYNPDRILIEPSGVGKLSDIIKAIGSAGLSDAINSLVCMVDAKKAKMYDKNFGEFFVDQIENAQTVILSRMDICKQENAEAALEIIRKHNEKCVVVTTPITELSDEDLLKAYEGFDVNLLSEDLLHHHHDDDDDEECDDPNCECHHHHHDDDEECDDPNCECHHHHGHHHAEDVFSSIGIETVKKYEMESLTKVLNEIAAGTHGIIVRAKGIVCDTEGKWHAFNITPDELKIEDAKAIPTGKIVVIGKDLDKENIKKLF